MTLMDAFAIVLFAVVVPVLVNFATAVWPERKILAAVGLVTAIVLQAALAYFALGPDGVSQLLALLPG